MSYSFSYKKSLNQLSKAEDLDNLKNSINSRERLPVFNKISGDIENNNYLMPNFLEEIKNFKINVLRDNEKKQLEINSICPPMNNIHLNSSAQFTHLSSLGSNVPTHYVNYPLHNSFNPINYTYISMNNNPHYENFQCPSTINPIDKSSINRFNFINY